MGSAVKVTHDFLMKKLMTCWTGQTCLTAVGWQIQALKSPQDWITTFCQLYYVCRCHCNRFTTCT